MKILEKKSTYFLSSYYFNIYIWNSILIIIHYFELLNIKIKLIIWIKYILISLS
jgi:hypothetical protein